MLAANLQSSNCAGAAACFSQGLWTPNHRAGGTLWLAHHHVQLKTHNVAYFNTIFFSTKSIFFNTKFLNTKIVVLKNIFQHEIVVLNKKISVEKKFCVGHIIIVM